MYTFGFHESAIFSLEYIKVCLCHDLSTHVESARLLTLKSRLELKFPTPYEWRSNSFPPGQEKASNSRGMPGGMLKRRFHWYIILRNIHLLIYETSTEFALALSGNKSQCRGKFNAFFSPFLLHFNANM